jgi:hypothetical protein
MLHIIMLQQQHFYDPAHHQARICLLPAFTLPLQFMSHNLSSHMSLGQPGEGQSTPNHPSSSGGAGLKSPSPCSTPPPLPRSSLTGLPYWMPGVGAISNYYPQHAPMSADSSAQAAGVSPFGGTSTPHTIPTVPGRSAASPPPPQSRIPSLPCLLGSPGGQPGGGAAHSSGSTLPRETSGEPLAGELMTWPRSHGLTAQPKVD